MLNVYTISTWKKKLIEEVSAKEKYRKIAGNDVQVARFYTILNSYSSYYVIYNIIKC